LHDYAVWVYRHASNDLFPDRALSGPTTPPARGHRAPVSASVGSAGGAVEVPSRPEVSPARRATRRDAGRIRVAIIGATGYAGAELVRLLARHADVEIAGLQGRDRDHEPIGSTHAHLLDTGLEVDAALPAGLDAVFLAMPHGAAVERVPELVAQGIAAIDLGPDFRLHDPADYPRWYGFEHPAPELLQDAVYGLPELHRAELAALADAPVAIVGAPGCYPTTTLLTLAPLARAGLIADLVVDAKSGVSGAGREAKLEMMFGEVNESVHAYGVGGHRHVAEIEQELAGLGAGAGAAAVDFIPHLIPMSRGILATCHVRPTRPVDQAELDALYADAYATEPFVTVVPTPPATRHVTGSNHVRVHVRWDERTGRILAFGVLDNLVKGAAGQAIQAFNVVFGLPETAALEQLPLAP
jgi:N-acetyl-gamma-glutamyl-phosphate reductase